MRIRNGLSSASLNSFGIDVPVDCLIEIEELSDLEYLDVEGEFHILGGGSNILLTEGITQPLVLVNNKGIDILVDNEDHSLVKFAAGENWHDAVLWALDNGLGGIENLSLIPGKCGAAPMQNIGAYGIEIKDVLHTVYAFDIKNKLMMSFHHTECGFDYRTSFFKTKWKGRFIISSIVLSLTKPGHHTVHTSYGAIKEQLKQMGTLADPTIRDVSNAVIAIRSSKLPDPEKLGNAGSFFKNPLIPVEVHDRIKLEFPELVSYPAGDHMKLAAGWLIDQCGFKGHREDSGAGVHDRQALVLVRRGSARGKDILKLASKIKAAVHEKFGVTLEEEVNLWT